MSYHPSNGLAWQGIGYGKDWFALEGLGDGLADARAAWVRDIAAYIEVQRRAGKTDEQIASYLQSTAAAKEVGYLGDKLPPDWINDAFKSVTPAGQKPVQVMSTGTKVAIGVGIALGAYLLLRRKR